MVIAIVVWMSTSTCENVNLKAKVFILTETVELMD